MKPLPRRMKGGARSREILLPRRIDGPCAPPDDFEPYGVIGVIITLSSAEASSPLLVSPCWALERNR